MMGKKKPDSGEAKRFEEAAREAGEGKPFDDVLRQLVKPQPKKKGDARKGRRPNTRTK